MKIELTERAADGTLLPLRDPEKEAAAHAEEAAFQAAEADKASWVNTDDANGEHWLHVKGTEGKAPAKKGPAKARKPHAKDAVKS